MAYWQGARDITRGTGGVRIEGLRELNAALDKVDTRIARTILKQAIGAAGKPIRTASRLKVPVQTGLLRLSIIQAVRTYRKRKGGSAVCVVGPRVDLIGKKIAKIQAGLKKPREPWRYAHLVEFGTAPHSLGKGSRLRTSKKRAATQTRGAMHPGTPARPFMRPAWDATKGRLLSIIQEEIAKRLMPYVNKVAKAQ